MVKSLKYRLISAFLIMGLFIVITEASAGSYAASRSPVFDLKPLQPVIRTWTTSAGVPVLYVFRSEIPMLDVGVVFDAGASREGKQWGLASITQSLLDQGFKGMSAQVIREQLADVGAQLKMQLSRDQSRVSLRTRIDSESLKVTQSIMAKLFSEPIFPIRRLQLKQTERLALLKQQQEQPTVLAHQAFFKELYGKHPYAHPTLGTPQTIRALKRKQVVDFFRRYYIQPHAHMVMVGALQPLQARAFSEAVTASIAPGHQANPLPQVHATHSSAMMQVPFDSHQTTSILGQLGLNANRVHRGQFMLANHILGGGMNSVLFQTIRADQGWVYSIYSQNAFLRAQGPFLIMFQTQHTQPDQVITAVQSTLDRFIQQGVSKPIFERARKQLITQLYRSVSTNEGLLNWLMNQAFYERPLHDLSDVLKDIQQASLSSTLQVFSRYIQAPQPVVIQVGQVGPATTLRAS